MGNNFDLDNPQHPALQDNQDAMQVTSLEQAQWLKEQIESPAQANPNLKKALQKLKSQTPDQS